jgi:sugar phosphate isomerase/epimerase
MKSNQIACQLYTLRTFLQTPAEIASTLKKVKAIGFNAVQPSGLGPIPDQELARMMKGEGLVCCAAHEPGEVLFGAPERVIEKMKTLDCRIASYPWPGGISFDTLESVNDFARHLNRTGQILHDAGITFCYHNHHMEFRRYGTRTILEILYAETDPRYVQAELDTYWVQFGGGNPAEWCRRMNGRLVNLHMKDYAIDSQNRVVFAEVGNGNLRWPEIIQAADASSCRWFIVEQDECAGDPFESIRQSLEFVQMMLN